MSRNQRIADSRNGFAIRSVAARRHAVRRGFATIIAIGLLGVVTIAGVAFASQMMREIGRERLALLEAQHEQAVQSARLWSRLHADELNERRRIELSLDAILSSGASGVAVLQAVASDSADRLIRCEIRITSSAQALTRVSTWMVR